MTSDRHAAGWAGVFVLVVTGAACTYTSGRLPPVVVTSGPAPPSASNPRSQEAGQAYLLTLAIEAAPASCRDIFWGGPEFYATASRRDPEIEEQLDGIRAEVRSLEPRIDELDETMAPLLEREHSTVPLVETERLELERLRRRRLELDETRRQWSSDERQSLRREREETDRAVRLLEARIPLSDEEARLLHQLKAQRAPLAARRNFLRQQRVELTRLVRMRTPGSLRVYPNDRIRVRLMEADAFADDTCARWSLTLGEEILDRGGFLLEWDGRTLLTLLVRPVPG